VFDASKLYRFRPVNPEHTCAVHAPLRLKPGPLNPPDARQQAPVCYTASMKIFVAASYSSEVDYQTGQVFDDYREYLEDTLRTIEASGHNVFCALREDNYTINKEDPAIAYRLDVNNIEDSDVLLAILDNTVSGGVQTEIGFAIALGKKVLLAHRPEDALIYFNDAMVRAGVVGELILPLVTEQLHTALAS